jgi:hypothetical protein
MTEHTEFLATMEAQLKKWDADVEVLRLHGQTVAAEARAAYFARVKQLRSNRAAAHKSFEQIRCASEEAGAQMHAGMVGAWETMKAALDKFTTEVRT